MVGIALLLPDGLFVMLVPKGLVAVGESINVRIDAVSLEDAGLPVELTRCSVVYVADYLRANTTVVVGICFLVDDINAIVDIAKRRRTRRVGVSAHIRKNCPGHPDQIVVPPKLFVNTAFVCPAGTLQGK